MSHDQKKTPPESKCLRNLALFIPTLLNVDFLHLKIFFRNLLFQLLRIAIRFIRLSIRTNMIYWMTKTRNFIV